MPIRSSAIGVAVALAAVLTCFTSTASASEIEENKWTGLWDTIESVYPHSSGYVVILSKDQFKGHTSDCNNGRQFEVKTTHPNYDAMSRTLLSAYLAGHQVTLFWDGKTTCRAYINRFQIRP